ncbi:MAG: single- stranded DNA-binding family protein [Candidatus Aramenus sulfurataquae]|jgi:hypothetical protein|uniref:DUF2258 domain-containing protein n=3 Tax=Candidatus Aramenus sulfurataquae TaxID=1326980 RepID=A0AAE3FKB3_9CREN|nr:DUF2258 domain-containing protein [Candidatus Aramenus sulfurataquae]
MAEEQRDIERAEEYVQLTPRTTALGGNRFELSTGLIIAARYADKLRRVALVALSKIAPRDVIIRDISELNKKLFEEITQKNIGKLDVIRLVVVAEYDPQEKKIKFENVQIQRFYTEEQCKKMQEDVIKENQRLKEEIDSIKKEIDHLRSILK